MNILSDFGVKESERKTHLIATGLTHEENRALEDFLMEKRKSLEPNQKLTKRGFMRAVILKAIGYGQK